MNLSSKQLFSILIIRRKAIENPDTCKILEIRVISVDNSHKMTVQLIEQSPILTNYFYLNNCLKVKEGTVLLPRAQLA